MRSRAITGSEHCRHSTSRTDPLTTPPRRVDPRSGRRFATRRTKVPVNAVAFRPERSLFWRGLGSSCAFLFTITTVLYFVAGSAEHFPAIIAIQLAGVAAALTAYILYRRSGIWVSSSGVSERGFFGRWVHVPAGEIDVVLLAELYRGSGTSTASQLFLCGADGSQLMRLRGQFWSLAKMRLVAEILDITPTSAGTPMSSQELLVRYPRLLYWFEKQPVAIAIAKVLAVMAGLLVLQSIINSLDASAA